MQPTTAEVTAPNQFGMIVPSSLGATSTQSDVLACNAYLTNNACGTLNTVPAQFTTGSTDAYPLGCYFTFSLASAANVVIDANNIYTATPPVQMRLFGEGVTGACGSIALGTDMLAESGELMSYSCLAAGNYTVQVIGNVDSLNLDYYWSNMLGFPVDLSITATSLPNTLFGLNRSLHLQLLFQPPRNMAPILGHVVRGQRASRGHCTEHLRLATAVHGPYAGDRLRHVHHVGPVRVLDGDLRGLSYPGVYTHAQFGDSILIGQETRPTYRFRKLDNQFFNPAAPENMGDVIANGLTLTSQYDRFTCTDNAVTIAGFDPCAPKAVYREFYLSQPAELWVSFENYAWHEAAGFRIFQRAWFLGSGHPERQRGGHQLCGVLLRFGVQPNARRLVHSGSVWAWAELYEQPRFP
ncbi:MAG: hypothetical protein IPG69_19380 [Flavobacteriales bacterium]|nr:hypothetical protein [Flavobacteriales bacterium]